MELIRTWLAPDHVRIHITVISYYQETRSCYVASQVTQELLGSFSKKKTQIMRIYWWARKWIHYSRVIGIEKTASLNDRMVTLDKPSDEIRRKTSDPHAHDIFQNCISASLYHTVIGLVHLHDMWNLSNLKVEGRELSLDRAWFFGHCYSRLHIHVWWQLWMRLLYNHSFR